MKELQELRNEVLSLRNMGELTKQTESILLHKLNGLQEAINYTRCCKSDSELLKVLGEHIAEQFDHKAEDVIEQLEWKFKNL